MTQYSFATQSFASDPNQFVYPPGYPGLSQPGACVQNHSLRRAASHFARAPSAFREVTLRISRGA